MTDILRTQPTDETPDENKSCKELDYTRELVGSAIHAAPHYLDVITLACAVTHKIDDFFTAPRILSLGEKGSGKSTVLTVANYLARGTTGVAGVLAMTAPSYVADFRLNPHWTPVIDEVNHLFGEAGSNGKASKFYTYLNQGYKRDTATAQHQENKVPLRVPIFGVVFMAGLGLACPPDLRERSIVIKMEKAASNVEVADFSDADTRAKFAYGKRMLESWTRSLPRLSTADVKGMHPKLTHRTMDVWGPLFAVAKAAGGNWVQKLLTAFERIELDAGVPVYAPETQILLDYTRFTEMYAPSEGVPSGDFAQWANDQEHGAYSGMKPGQFKQFAKAVLGPTTPFYRADMGKTVRGWSDTVHTMNLEAAARELEMIAQREESEVESEAEDWDDF